MSYQNPAYSQFSFIYNLRSILIFKHHILKSPTQTYNGNLVIKGHQSRTFLNHKRKKE